MEIIARIIAFIWDMPEFVKEHADVVILLLVIAAILWVLVMPWHKKPPRR